MGNTRDIWLAATAISALLAGQADVHAQERAGVARIVNPLAKGQLRGSSVRTIQVGDAVFRNERISTGSTGRVQLQLLDKTSVTVGPNSDLVIDKFVYNPSTNTGSMAMRYSKGVFRFVGGRASKDQPVEVNTPTAVIGIRGGILLMRDTPDGGIQAIFLAGDEMTATTNDGDTQSITRTGFMFTITPDGQVTISRAPDALIKEILEQLEQEATDEEGVGGRLTVTGLDDETWKLKQVPESDDGSGLGPQTLEELQTELGIDIENFESLQDLIDALELDGQAGSGGLGGTGTVGGGEGGPLL